MSGFDPSQRMKHKSDNQMSTTESKYELISSMVQRHLANVKERHRTTNVNTAFSILRTHIPTEPRDRKLSKIETLRLATSYIGHLAAMIQARAEGDFDEQACQRYSFLLGENREHDGCKYICTFCAAESKRIGKCS